ncbi:hypothetical protein [Mangrovicoccus sp. HB161399]|uniref:hypothetical protein n=1 Tax=Mangrovicoccus sp. HB161399 TaxID=2720392 RepID=UPI0015582D7E|nr:hypothetical protein [Mangrovicoccus sp. HB161399]
MTILSRWNELGLEKAKDVQSFLLRRTFLGGPTGSLDTLMLHIGGPKTATSTLQHWLAENRWNLRKSGVDLRVPSDIRGRNFIGSALRYINGKDDTPDTSGFDRLFGGVSTERLLISEESLTNSFIPGASRNRNGFDCIDKLISFLQEVKVPKIKILLTVRRQDQFIASCYGHRLQRSGEKNSFSDWKKDNVDFKNLSWLGVVNKLDVAFGEENVAVVPYELIQTEGDRAFYERCLSSLNISAKGHVEPESRARNPSLTDKTEQIARIVNTFPTTSPEERSRRTALIERINKFAYRSGDRTFRPYISDDAKICQLHYKVENTELAARKFPDLCTSFSFNDGNGGRAN